MSSRTFEPGTYLAELTKVSLGKASTGNPQVAFSFKPIGKLSANPDAEPAPCPDYERTVFRTITDNTVQYLVQDLEALGYDRESFDELDSGHPDAFPFAGKQVQVRLAYETYQGKEKERWSFAFGGGGLSVTPLERREMSQLNAQFGKHLRRGALSAPPPASRPAARPAAQAQRPAARPAQRPTEEQAEEVF